MNAHATKPSSGGMSSRSASGRTRAAHPGRDSMDHQYGRRIEADRSWTVYHVFTGVPAHADGQTMTGLSRSDATDGMLSLNRRNDGRRKDRGSLTAHARLARSYNRGLPVMTLDFPNRSRSFDEARNAVRFIGHDGMFEVPFFVEAGRTGEIGRVAQDGTVRNGMPHGFRRSAQLDPRCRTRSLFSWPPHVLYLTAADFR